MRGCQGLVEHGLSSVMSGMDNVRNMTGSPIAGIDPHEFLDVRPLNYGAPSSCSLAALRLAQSLLGRLLPFRSSACYSLVETQKKADQ